MIFSVGVLMVIQVSGALGTRMRYAGLTSELAVVASQRLDSLEAAPFASVAPGTATQTLTVQGITYDCTVTVAAVTPLLKRLDVSLVPPGGDGPSHSVTSYTAEIW